jgi:hypothetical protein
MFIYESFQQPADNRPFNRWTLDCYVMIRPQSAKIRGETWTSFENMYIPHLPVANHQPLL